MKELSNGLIDINGIIIYSNDSLTNVLQKTMEFKKIMRNENNKQIVYFENVKIYNFFTTCTLFFSNIGKLLYAYIGFSMDNDRNYNQKYLKIYYKK